MSLETDKCPFANLPEPRGGQWGPGLTAAKITECRWVETRTRRAVRVHRVDTRQPPAALAFREPSRRQRSARGTAKDLRRRKESLGPLHRRPHRPVIEPRPVPASLFSPRKFPGAGGPPRRARRLLTLTNGSMSSTAAKRSTSVALVSGRGSVEATPQQVVRQ
jgi:hypothetical protein